MFQDLANIKALPENRFTSDEKSLLESKVHEVIKQMAIEIRSKGFHFTDQNDGTYFLTWNFKTQEDESGSMEDCIMDAVHFYEIYQLNKPPKM